LIGKTLSHFKITAKLGEGGMGEVYRAEDTKPGREVAIKVLPETFTRDAERLARFEREAKVLASLNHPNIAAIYEIGREDDAQFLAMELAEGEDLAAHESGIAHRDLKPGNVMVDPDSEAVKLLDFMGHQRWDVAPGGDRFLMVENSQDYRIVIVQNWFEELERLAPTTP